MRAIRRGHPPGGYLTATQAKKRLGDISDGKFRTLITAGKIERYIPPGMTQGFYKREDVERLAEEFRSPSHRGTRTSKDDVLEQTVFDWIDAIQEGNLEELRRILDLAAQDTQIDAYLRTYLKEDAEDAKYALYLKSVIPALYGCNEANRKAVMSEVDKLLYKHDL